QDADGYLEWAATQGRIVLSETPIEARRTLLADWARHAVLDLDGCAMIADHRADVDALNDAARRLLRHAHVLGPHVHTSPAGVAIARNDRVVCLLNDSAIGVSNGTRGTILGARGRELLLAVDGRGCRHLPLAYVDGGHVAHAYALTGHKSQGQTLDH